MKYRSREAYYQELEKRAAPPEGFQSSTVSFEFTPTEKAMRARMNLALILLDMDSPSFGGVFTRNRFCGAPITIGRQIMNRREVRGILINNKIANVGTEAAVADAESVLTELRRLLSLTGEALLPASTGIIGWQLPLNSISQSLPGLVEGLHSKSMLPLAEAIMTTDSYAKVRSVDLGQGKILGIAKGAGMIEPNMATLLGFILTDVRIDRDELRETLSFCVNHSFNQISVDGDMSTSDMVIAISSGRKDSVPRDIFREALLSVCRGLAEDIVRNGEGVSHVIKVRVLGAGGEGEKIGKAVVNSLLVKTAVFGNDANVGRIVSAAGHYLGNNDSSLDLGRLSLKMGGIEIFVNGNFTLDREKEKALCKYLGTCRLDPEIKGYPQHERSVELLLDLGSGEGAAEVLGADLSYEYIRENAEYRS